MIYHTASDVDLSLADLPPLPRPARVLLTSPDHFEVAYVINPHMAGHVGTVDHGRARAQWQALREAYEALGIEVHVVPGVKGLPDMVFCANQTLPYRHPLSERCGVILSRMHAPQRRDEVPHFAGFFRTQGYDVRPLPETVTSFEGMGDALWHPGRCLLWGGYGFRTDPSAYRLLTEWLGVPVMALRLVDPDFYHLDTCLSVLSPTAALIYPGAFDDDGLALIRHGFEHVLEAPEEEARHNFACNAHCPDGRHVLIQRGSRETNRILRAAGFEPVEVDTDEFIKAGGSVFCMKQMFW
ncbi:MAG: amidinotransferase [Bacteroidetes bacterium]|nr:MAG: amidinotransferase [Bacteroidota bacterium]